MGMARKEVIVAIQDREQKLRFRIRQMSAMQLEQWINTAFALLPGDTPAFSDLQRLFMGNLSHVFGHIGYDQVRPLSDALLDCCTLITDEGERSCDPEFLETCVEDVRTLHELRGQALCLNMGFLETGGRKQFLLPQQTRYRNAVSKRGRAGYANVSGLMGTIVSRGLATLHELQSIYSFEDALDMSEIIMVQDYNEWAEMEEAKRRR
jgi:hypothetical protein